MVLAQPRRCLDRAPSMPGQRSPRRDATSGRTRPRRGQERYTIAHRPPFISLVIVLLAVGGSNRCFAASDAPLPPGVRAVWDLDHAWREATPTRERVCVNGLWRWQPAAGQAEDAVPADGWGYFKVPGGLAGDHRLPAEGLADGLSAPELEGPEARGGHLGVVPAGDRDPRRLGGPADRAVGRVPELLCGGLRGREKGRRGPLPGRRGGPHRPCPSGHEARPQPGVVAMPLKAVMLSYTDSATRAGGEGDRRPPGAVRRRLPGRLARRGRTRRIVRVETSVRKGEVTVAAAPRGPGRGRAIHASRGDHPREGAGRAVHQPGL